jgi:hypothetical protein
LDQKDFRPIPGWSILLFLVLVVPLTFIAVRLSPVQTMLAILGAFFGAALVAVALAVAPLGRAAISALGLRPANWRYPVYGVVGTLMLSVAVSQLGIEPQGVKQAMEIASDPAQFVLSLVLLAVLAPIVEELVFRGLLYGWIEGRWGSIAAFIVSSVAFAAAHWEPAHVVLVFPLGVLFGWIRRRSNSLMPSMVAHVINNGFALVAAAYLGAS